MNKNEKLKYSFKYLQHFGDKESESIVNEEDIISSLQFDKTGDFVALGDKAGRLIIFQFDNESNEYNYLHEFQSHVREFDYLRSTEVDEKITGIQWFRPQGNL